MKKLSFVFILLLGSSTLLAVSRPIDRIIQTTHCAMDLLAGAAQEAGYDIEAAKENVASGRIIRINHVGQAEKPAALFLYLRKFFSAKLGGSIQIDPGERFDLALFKQS